MIFENNSNLEKIYKQELKNFNEIKKSKYSVDIARGKPCKEQILAVKEGYLKAFDDAKDKIDSVANYGILDGIPAAKEIFASILDVKKEEIIIGGNSSLNLMYDHLQRGFQFGFFGEKPWSKQEVVKFICPSPGYDRHFGVCQALGIDMITIPMTENGPDMNIVENLVATDSTIKGIWCVPKYSNPTGVTYSEETVKRLASMKTAAKDFIIMWDNAYVIHDLYEETEPLLNILRECEKVGNPNRVYMFTSTSKITFPGAGISCVSSSIENIKEILSHMTYQTIGYNKINQLMHVEYIKDMNNLKSIMRMHANIIRPKFERIEKALEENFGNDCDIIEWTKPKGGYFISVNLLPGTAKKVFSLCKEAGLTITGAGATYPYKQDEKDSNLRIAPTFTSNEDLEIACKILVCCIKLACIEKLLNK